jgi:hypothetical protein
VSIPPLYELVRYRDELERLSDSGEIPPEEIADTLALLEGDIREKAINVAGFTRNLEAAADVIKAAGRQMLARAERLEKRAESVRNYLLFQCQAAGITKIEAPWFVISVRKNPPAVVIDDPSAIPQEYMRPPPPPPPPAPDKTAISRALKAGDDVPGAHLMQGERLEIKE